MSEKNLSVLVIAESTGRSTHLRISYHMVAALLFFTCLVSGGLFYIVREMINNSATADLMDENLLLRSQVQDLDIDLIELQRQVELLQMYAAQAEMSNSGPWELDLHYPDGIKKTEQILHKMVMLRQEVQMLYPMILQHAEAVSSQKLQFSRIPKEWPCEGVITSNFRYRINPVTGKRAFHAGIDIGAPMYTKIYAPIDGTVVFSGWRGGYGNTVILDHGQGVTSRYAHASKLVVKVGQQVKRGDKIALMGSTGQSTGSHLHYEIRVDGVAIDPLKYLAR